MIGAIELMLRCVTLPFSTLAASFSPALLASRHSIGPSATHLRGESASCWMSGATSSPSLPTLILLCDSRSEMATKLEKERRDIDQVPASFAALSRADLASSVGRDAGGAGK